MPTTQSKIQELELLYKISSSLNKTLDFESVAHPILEVVESTMGVEHVELFGSERGALVGVLAETPGRVEQVQGRNFCEQQMLGIYQA